MLQLHDCRMLPTADVVRVVVPPDGQQPTVLPFKPQVAAGQQPTESAVPVWAMHDIAMMTNN